MVTLAIDTATTTAVVGLVEDGVVRAESVLDEDAHVAQQILIAVASVLERAGQGVRDLDRIAVGVGPGSFTGLRVGIATALGLGDGADVPVAPTDTLRALRVAAGEEVIAVIDARRGEVCAAGPSIEEGVYSPAHLATMVTPADILVGDGAVRYRSILGDSRIPADTDVRHRPCARGIADAAVDGAPLEPRYLRLPDAVTTGGHA